MAVKEHKTCFYLILFSLWAKRRFEIWKKSEFIMVCRFSYENNFQLPWKQTGHRLRKSRILFHFLISCYLINFNFENFYQKTSVKSAIFSTSVEWYNNPHAWTKSTLTGVVYKKVKISFKIHKLTQNCIKKHKIKENPITERKKIENSEIWCSFFTEWKKCHTKINEKKFFLMKI